MAQPATRARHLLESTDLPIDHVADRVGFATGASLRHHLQRAIGVSPLAYPRTFRTGAQRMPQDLDEPRCPPDRVGNVDVVTSIDDLGPMLANIRDFWLAHGSVERRTTPTALFRSGVAHPLFNGVRQSADGDRLDRVKDLLDGVPWMWWLGPDSPVGLADDLSRQGAEEVGTLPIMAAEIAALPEVEPPPGLEIDQVTRADEIDAWMRMLVPHSDLPSEIAPQLSVVEQAKILPDDGDYVRLAGRIDGRIVASTALLVSHGVAGIYMVSTKPSHRRRGIGRAITSAALQVATERDTQVAVLNPTDQGEPLYRGMGFAHVSAYRIFVPSSETAVR